MSGSNSQKMSLEDKIVQRLKDKDLYELVGDEESINELVKRAIQEALFKPVVVSIGLYSQTQTKPSVSVSAAIEVAEKAAQNVVESLVDDLAKNPEFKSAVMAVFAASLPEFLLSRWDHVFKSMFSHEMGSSFMSQDVEKLKLAIQNISSASL